MKRKFSTITVFVSLLVLAFLSACTSKLNKTKQAEPNNRIEVIFDTDANNELDDQHALAYLVFNSAIFDVKAITVNATHSGGAIEKHYQEAERVMKLCNVFNQIPLLQGANGNFETIRSTLSDSLFDGKAAIDFIVEEARKERDHQLVLIPVGKLTNIALALEKAPDIKDKVRIVWLGSNYPDPGEYNQDNDLPSLNYILDQNVSFEMVTVRYGANSGSSAVSVTPSQMETMMPGTGPLANAVEGRHGGSFTRFGDYSIDLFRHIDLHGNPPSRSLFDVVAVAVVKNPSWGEARSIAAPIMDIGKNEWVNRPGNKHSIVVWENFSKKAILDDFFSTMKNQSEE